MWPKTSTPTLVSLTALLTFTLTLTLVPLPHTSAQAPCKQFTTVSQLLTTYNLPPGIFPLSEVKTFSCDALSTPGTDMAVSLVIQTRAACTITREVAGLSNVIQYDSLILATVTPRLVTGIRGVIVGLYATSSSPFGPLDILLTLDQVRVINNGVHDKFVQFSDVTGFASPPFPIDSFSSEIPLALCVPVPDLRLPAHQPKTNQYVS